MVGGEPKGFCWTTAFPAERLLCKSPLQQARRRSRKQMAQHAIIMPTKMAMPRMMAKLAETVSTVLLVLVPPQPLIMTSDVPQRGMPCTSTQPTDGTTQKPQMLLALVQLAQPVWPEHKPGEECGTDPLHCELVKE